MRLLNTTSLTFREFAGSYCEPYAILSHCWYHGSDWQEPTHQQALGHNNLDDSLGWQKVIACCRIARLRGLQWAWIDTVCIDKSSSMELGETINCMYAWYKGSTECYVFLDDVPVEDDADVTRPTLQSDHLRSSEHLVISRWFTRGWTLQELIAPSTVLFYNKFGDFIGTRTELAAAISRATGIDPLYLTHTKHIHHASIAQRMSWASRRKTTREEDMAYSLLGIFDVNLPLLYGEGPKGFLRLQLAIIEQSDDTSIFAWGMNALQNYNMRQGMLANSPMDFSGSESVTSLPSMAHAHGSRFQVTKKAIVYRYTASGFELLRTMLGLYSDAIMDVKLACTVSANVTRTYQISIRLRRNPHDGRYYRVGPRRVMRHRASGVIEFVGDLVAYEKAVHVVSHQHAGDQITAPTSGKPDTPHLSNVSIRQTILWLVRFSMSLLLLFLYLALASGNTPEYYGLMFGVLVLVRDLAPSGVFSYILIAMIALFQALVSPRLRE